MKGICYITFITLLGFFSSCCDCFHRDEGDVFIQLDSFDVTDLDSVLVIRTDKDDFNKIVDTTQIGISNNSFGAIWLQEWQCKENSFIIYNDSPFFRHTISGYKSKHSKCGITICCCTQLLQKDYFFDSIHMNKESRPVITKK